ncbi:hypothetical protein [Actimicrobium sp. CCI2.3]|uniref:hypothetical protein n=1 Tax=Actimicrobium sp. CCI2.3 TaxID=3048616 RepID=UPI002AB58C6C|nr:hypothetical protein [Actimicrobium sp. CCI2.3]MDY7574165.1 hypothetical protein [Actimicrobium sp. CCI2.3]MEB0024020.1 hypothetical protein [Actimicrobium sp. CCI2.3]
MSLMTRDFPFSSNTAFTWGELLWLDETTLALITALRSETSRNSGELGSRTWVCAKKTASITKSSDAVLVEVPGGVLAGMPNGLLVGVLAGVLAGMLAGVVVEVPDGVFVDSLVCIGGEVTTGVIVPPELFIDVLRDLEANSSELPLQPTNAKRLTSPRQKVIFTMSAY